MRKRRVQSPFISGGDLWFVLGKVRLFVFFLQAHSWVLMEEILNGSLISVRIFPLSGRKNLGHLVLYSREQTFCIRSLRTINTIVPADLGK